MTTPIESLAAETLLEAVSAAFASTYSVAFPDIDFTPTGEMYLDVSWLPNGSAFEPLGAGGTHQGLFQVAVMYPSSPAPGVVEPSRIAGTVADTFDRGSRFFGDGCSVKISTRPVIAQPFPSDGYVRVPVTISYQATKDPT